jgi:hypothetical protein
MAQHCFNYHFKTNERYMNEMERERPIRQADEALVRDSFKEIFHLPIHDWLLIQPDNKRANLCDLLHGSHARKPAPAIDSLKLSRANWTATRRPELILQTPIARIDFNRSIYGPTPFRPDPRAVAPTLVATEGVFGFTDPWTPKPLIGSATMPDYYVKHFFKPAVAARLTPLSDEYLPLIVELMNWTEKKTMGFPIDPVRGHDSITPTIEGAISKAKLEEDHMYAPGHHKVKKSKLARDLTTKTLGAQARKLTSSRYQDVFCDDIHEDYLVNGPPEVTPAFIQVRNGLPWAQFPELKDKPARAENPELARQVVQNRLMGKANRAIFQAKTCL